MLFLMMKMSTIPTVNTEPKLPIKQVPDLIHPTYNTIPKPPMFQSLPRQPSLNPADLVDIIVNNVDGKLIEYSQHPIGIRCVINNNFSMIHGGKLQLKITDPNTSNECFINVTGDTKNQIINMITSNY